VDCWLFGLFNPVLVNHDQTPKVVKVRPKTPEFEVFTVFFTVFFRAQFTDVIKDRNELCVQGIGHMSIAVHRDTDRSMTDEQPENATEERCLRVMHSRNS